MRSPALGLLATLAVAALPACGARSSLYVEEEPAPGEACTGWKGELFVAPARDTPTGMSATALDLFPSHGDGTFGAPVKIDLKEPFTGVVIDDFDGDGSLEIHLWGLLTGLEYLVDHSCDTGTWLKSPIVGGAAPPRHELSSIGDINNDGFVDAVGWVPGKDGDGQPNADAFEVYASLGGPGGAFESMKIGLSLKEYHVWWLAATRHIRDMDEDGCADLVFIKYDDGGPATSSVLLAKGDCTGHFGPPAVITTTPFPGTGNDIGDVDGDGHMDLLTGLDDDGDPGQAWVLKGDGLGSLGSPVPVFDVSDEESGHDGAGFGGVFLYDWDRDGRLDALSGYTTAPKFSAAQIDIRMNLGDLKFGAPTVVDPAAVPLVVPAPVAVAGWFAGPATK